MFKDLREKDVKTRILLVARDLFIQKGYDGTSVRDIAKAANTNVALVNYYYQSKYNLFEMIFEEALNVLFQRIFYVINSDKPFFELIESWISSYYEVLMENPHLPIFILKEINQNPESLIERLQRRNPFELFTRISNRLEAEVKKGTIKETPSLDFLLNIISLCIFPFMFGGMATKVAGKSIEDYHEVLKQHKNYVIEFVISALKP